MSVSGKNSSCSSAWQDSQYHCNPSTSPGRRRPGEVDGLQWYCESCHALLHEEFFPLTDIETQLQPAFERFYGNEALRRCRQCGTLSPVPPHS